MRNIITIVGARPQFIKAAAVSRQLIKAGLEEKIIHTGQHFDENMSQVFFDEMEIPKPAFNLDIHGLTHGAMTGRMLEGIEKILIKEEPDGVLVYGDTNSTLAGALAASKLHIPLIHVEAGLRSFNMAMPEEINRIVTDRISNILFCPTETAVQNLQNEGLVNGAVKIIRNGDVMQDAAIFYAEKAAEKSNILEKINTPEFVLATIHRQENTDNQAVLSSIISGLNEINQSVPVVVPLHPRTKQILKNAGLQVDFKIIDPVGYFDMIMLLKHCSMVITDSGGVQKEAFFFRKHCITLREQTEWVELVNHNFNILAGSDNTKLKQAFEYFCNKQSDFSVDLYGGGNAAVRIAEELVKV
jgi:UDP-GlcNAc3NAcA epimerase